MKVAAIFAVLVAVASASAIVPKEHHSRFLKEHDELKTELDSWKNTLPGRIAKANGYYKEDPHESTAALEDQLSRFFMTKMAIEEVKKANPLAVFSVNTPFTLMTEKEFAAFVARSGSIEAHALALNATATRPHRDLEAAATSVDWTTGKCVAPVKDQGSCGSCWSFSSISTLESAICLKTGKLTRLSEQELVSCDKTDSGCEGGLITTGIGYLKKQGAISTEASYPYTSGNTAKNGVCTATSNRHTKVSYKIRSVVNTAASESAFLAAITKQPLGVAIAAGNNAFKQYTSGILSSCPTNQLDHAVVAVGYDARSFKIRNSWGSSWGEAGYVRVARQGSSKAACGLINTYAAYPAMA